MPNDGLFAAPEPANPDAAIARQVITSYYTERADESRAELVKAQVLHDARASQLAAWTERGEITHETLAGRLDTTAISITAYADSAHMAAMRAAIPELGGQRTPDRFAAAHEAEANAQAVRRWLADQGHRLGEMAPDAQPANRRRRDTRG